MRQVVCSFGLIASFLVQSSAAPSNHPLFAEEFSFTNRFIELKAFNNSSDLLLSIRKEDETGQVTYNDVPALIRGGQVIRLFPTGTPNLNGAYVTGMSETRDDGGLYVAGTAIMKDGFWRAALWDVAADGSFSFRTMPNIILPPESVAPGEQPRSYGMSVNRSGVLVGSGVSYLAGVATVWQPPYANAVRYLLSTGSSFDYISDSGLALANGVEFEHGGSRNRYAAAVLHPGGIPMEVPLLEFVPGWLWPNGATSMSGEWVAGYNHTSDGTAGFAWQIGSPTSIRLPIPDEIPEKDRQHVSVHSINSEGQVVGFMNGGDYSQNPILWQFAGGRHTPYFFNELVPGQSRTDRVEEILINDHHHIAFTIRENQSYRLKVFKPLTDGLVEFSWESTSAEEEAGVMEFRVNLFRAPGNTGPVTVHYRTSDDTANAPADYTAQTSSISWAPSEAGEKRIHVPIKDNATLDDTRSFKLLLTSATGAQLGPKRECEGSIYDAYQQFDVRNQMFAGWTYGCAVLQGEPRVVLKVERIGGSDGAITFTNFNAWGFTAHQGVDYEIPADLSVSWAAGESGVKSLSIPLLKKAEPNSQVISFAFSAAGKYQGAERDVQLAGAVVILPDASGVQPVIDSSRVLNHSDGLELVVSAVQGSIVELEQSLAGLGGRWLSTTQTRCEDGEARLSAPLNPTNKHGFFRIRVKQE